MIKVITYTDGSCNAKNGKGGFGVYSKIYRDNKIDSVKSFFRGFNGTKTGRMEIGAVLTALTFMLDFPKGSKIVIRSDSQYVVNTINKAWYRGWRIRNWSGKKNKDLWEALIEVYEYLISNGVHVDIQWVKGHSGVEGNEIADGLARQGYKTDPSESTDDFYSNQNDTGGFRNW